MRLKSMPVILVQLIVVSTSLTTPTKNAHLNSFGPPKHWSLRPQKIKSRPTVNLASALMHATLFFRNMRRIVGQVLCTYSVVKIKRWVFRLFVSIICSSSLKARLTQALWTTTPKNFYHPNQFSIRCIVRSFNFWLTVHLGVVV